MSFDSYKMNVLKKQLPSVVLLQHVIIDFSPCQIAFLNQNSSDSTSSPDSYLKTNKNRHGIMSTDVCGNICIN